MSDQNFRLKTLIETYEKLMTGIDYQKANGDELNLIRSQTSRLLNCFQNCDQKLPGRNLFISTLLSPLATSCDKAINSNVISILTLICTRNVKLRRRFGKLYPSATNDLIRVLVDESKEVEGDDEFMLAVIKLLSYIAPSDSKFTLKCRLNKVSKTTVDLLAKNQTSSHNLIPLLKLIKLYSKDSVLCTRLHKHNLIEYIHSIYKNHSTSKNLVLKLTLLTLSRLLRYKCHLEVFIHRRGVDDLLRCLLDSSKGKKVSKVRISVACVLNQVASIKCGAEELQRLRAGERLLQLSNNIRSRACNHTFILILFDLMLKSTTATHRIPLASLASCYKFTLPVSANYKARLKNQIQSDVEKLSLDADRFSEKGLDEVEKVEKLIEDVLTNGAFFENVSKAEKCEIPVKEVHVREVVEDFESFFEEHFILEDLIKHKHESLNEQPTEMLKAKSNCTINNNKVLLKRNSENNLSNNSTESSLLYSLDEGDYNVGNFLNKLLSAKKKSAKSVKTLKGITRRSRNKVVNKDSKKSAFPNTTSDIKSGDKSNLVHDSATLNGDAGAKGGDEGVYEGRRSEDNDDGTNTDEAINSKFLKLGCKALSIDELSFEALHAKHHPLSALPTIYNKNNNKKIKKKLKRKKIINKKINNDSSILGASNDTSSKFSSKVGGDYAEFIASFSGKGKKSASKVAVGEVGKTGEASKNASELKAGLLKRSCSRKSSYLSHLHNSPYLRQMLPQHSLKSSLDPSIKLLIRASVKTNNNNTRGEEKKKKPLCKAFTLDDTASLASTAPESDKSFSGSSNASSGSSGSSGGSGGGSSRRDKLYDASKDNRVAYQLINLQGDSVPTTAYNQLVSNQEGILNIAHLTKAAIHVTSIAYPELHGFAVPPYKEGLLSCKKFPTMRRKMTEDVGRYLETSGVINRLAYDLDSTLQLRTEPLSNKAFKSKSSGIQGSTFLPTNRISSLSPVSLPLVSAGKAPQNKISDTPIDSMTFNNTALRNIITTKNSEPPSTLVHTHSLDLPSNPAPSNIPQKSPENNNQPSNTTNNTSSNNASKPPPTTTATTTTSTHHPSSLKTSQSSKRSSLTPDTSLSGKFHSTESQPLDRPDESDKLKRSTNLQNNDLNTIKKHCLLSERSFKPSNHLLFDSQFECGNLRKAIQVREREYDLILNADINTSSHQQWFYFKVSGMEAYVDYRFNVVNCEKVNSQFNFGMQPVMFSVREASEGRCYWFRVGREVCYYKNHVTRPQPIAKELKNEGPSFYHTSSFNVNFPHPNDVCYIAYHYPYSYTKLMFHLEEVLNKVANRNTLKASKNTASNNNNTTNNNININANNNSKLNEKKTNKNKNGTNNKNANKNNNFFWFRNSTKSDASGHSTNALYVKRQSLCRTLNGNDVPILTITSLPNQIVNKRSNNSNDKDDKRNDNVVDDVGGNNNVNNKATPPKPQNTVDSLDLETLERLKSRPYVVITGRVHPGETNASWMMQGTIDYLLSEHPVAQSLRDMYVFKVVPMLNPDGVINGNHRCSLSGDDLNRQWLDPSPILHPTIYYTKALMKFIKSRLNCSIYTYCDYHGHSRKKNVFVYGCSAQQSWREADYLNACVRPDGSADQAYKVIPSLLNQHSPSFHLASCSFTVERAKESTARVVVWRELGVVRSYTMESTYSGFDQGPYEGSQVNPYHLEEMGQKFLEALLMSRDYADDLTTDVAVTTSMSLEAKRSSRLSVDCKSLSDLKLNTGGLCYDLNNNHLRLRRSVKPLSKASSVFEVSRVGGSKPVWKESLVKSGFAKPPTCQSTPRKNTFLPKELTHLHEEGVGNKESELCGKGGSGKEVVVNDDGLGGKKAEEDEDDGDDDDDDEDEDEDDDEDEYFDTLNNEKTSSGDDDDDDVDDDDDDDDDTKYSGDELSRVIKIYDKCCNRGDDDDQS